MKKLLLSLSMLAAISFTSCSSDDSESNSAPDATTLKVFDANLGVSIEFIWNPSLDANGDTVVYDILANGEVVKEGTDFLDYRYVFADHKSIKYPITFQLVSKDNKGGETKSNEEVITDPAIGKWQLVEEYENGNIVGISDCTKKSTTEFKADFTALDQYYEENSATNECIANTPFRYDWKYLSENIYEASYDGGNEKETSKASFSGDTMIIFYEDTTGSYEDVYKKI